MAVYAGGEDLRKVTGVGLINRTGPDSGGSGAMYHNNRRRGQGDFAKLLASERDSIDRNEEISVKSTGYGSNGQPSNVLIKMKDYTFQ